jgi:hypothetical protein
MASSLYTDAGMIWFSTQITWEKNKKVFVPPPNWVNLTMDTCTSHQSDTKNGVMLLTGRKNRLLVLDADIAKATTDGSPIPDTLLSTLDSCCTAIVNTPNGRHYYFTIEETEEYKNGTDIRWHGSQIKFLDVRGDGGCIIAPPTKYLKKKEEVSYKWIVGSHTTISPLPQEIKEALRFTPTVESFVQEFEESTDETIVRDLLSCLPVSVFDSYDSWLQIGFILFNIGMSCTLWDEFSKQGRGWTTTGCRDKWMNFKKGKLGLGSLWRLVKLYRPEEFARLQRKHINIKNLLDPVHKDAARLFYLFNPDAYVFCTTTGWYECMENNSWLNRGKEEPK